MPLIYHITTAENWNTAKSNGYYEAPSLHSEGFIHCSMEQQVEAVIERYFKGQTNLLKLVIDPNLLENRVVMEEAPSLKEEFPHIYGRINLDAVIDVIVI